MRIHLKIRTQQKCIPFDHQNLLTGTIHKWMGWNNEHGKVSLYSFSQITGGKASSTGLQLPDQTSFFFSSFNTDLIKKVIGGICSDPTMFLGLTVSEIIIQEDPDLSERSLFFPASPIFIKRRAGEKEEHILYSDPRAGDFMKDTLITKLTKAGLSDDSLNVGFDTTFPKAGTKKITYNNIQNRANWCPVIIEGKPEIKQFAWNVGLGNSTGIGFGAIK